MHLGLLWTFDLAANLPWSVSLLLCGFAALAWAVHVVRGRERGGAPRAALVLLVAALLRLTLLPLPPTLSDDLLRYVWDGRVTAAGQNPYRWAPEAPELASLRDERWRKMPHKEVPTVYPPLALGAFSIAASTPRPIWAVKLLMVAADLLTCLLLLRLADRRKIPRHRILWYAWNPLVVLEVAGMGHVDALAVTGAVAAVAFLTSPRPRSAAAGAAAAAGILAKLGPLAALPLWTRHAARPVRFLAVAGGLTAVAVLPVLVSVGGVPPGLITYGVDWEFNGPLYEPLWRLLDAVDADGWAARSLDAYKEATEQWTRWNFLYPWFYPQFFAKALLALLALAVVARSVFDRELLDGTRRLFGGLLLAAATVYPWYLLWVLPWAALTGAWAWIVLSASILLVYIPQHSTAELFPVWFCLAWLPFWATALVSFWQRRRGPWRSTS